jgi:hypothetical protein
VSFLTGLRLAYDLGVVALAVVAVGSLRRWRGDATVEPGLWLAALAQLLDAAVRVGAAHAATGAWLWLVVTACNLGLIYLLWQAGLLLLGLREASRAEPARKRAALRSAHIRAVASWPGRRSG